MFTNLRITAVALVCALTLLAGTASAAFAQPNNDQTGLINVNLQEVTIQIPVSVAVPIGVALNACGINILALQEGDNNCTAENVSIALSQAIAEAMLGTGNGNGGGAQNNQNGLVNVNVQEVLLQVPVSVAVPVGIAANVCGVNVASLQQGDNNCDAKNASVALTQAVARAIFEQNQ